MFNTKTVSNQIFGTCVSLLFGSSSYSFEEARPFLVKKDGMLNWFLNKTDIFDPIYKNGCVPKLLNAIEVYLLKYDDEFEDFE